LVSAGLPPVAGDGPEHPNAIGTGVLVGVAAGAAAVGVAVGAAAVGAVSAAKIVKCDVPPVMVPEAVSIADPPSTVRQVAVAGSKKKIADGAGPEILRVTPASGVKLGTGAPVNASAALRSTTVLASCCPLLSGGALVRATVTRVSRATAPAGKATPALPSGKPTLPPPGPIIACATSGSGAGGELDRRGGAGGFGGGPGAAAISGADPPVTDADPPAGPVSGAPAATAGGCGAGAALVGAGVAAATAPATWTTCAARPLSAVALRSTTLPSSVPRPGPAPPPGGPPAGGPPGPGPPGAGGVGSTTSANSSVT